MSEGTSQAPHFSMLLALDISKSRGPPKPADLTTEEVHCRRYFADQTKGPIS